MKHNKKRVSKIIDELVSYFFKVGSKNIHIDVLEEKLYYKMTFVSDIDSIKEDDINKLVKCLNCEKSAEVEEYYWELTGECNSDSELSIVGMMIDNFEVSIKDKQMELVIYRNKK